MRKCTQCGSNEAVIFLSGKQLDSDKKGGLCMSCAYHAHIKELEPFFNKSGINESNVDFLTEQMNGFANMNPDEMQDYINEMTEKLGPDSPLSNFDPNVIQNGFKDAIMMTPEELMQTMESVKGDFPGLDDDNGLDSETIERIFDEIQAEETGEDSDKEMMPVARGGDQSDINDFEYGSKQAKDKNTLKRKFLDQFGTNLTDLARKGGIDRMVGRDKELRRMIQILNRRTKNNPVLIGEPGVGKSAIAEGLARSIVLGEVPEKLMNMEVYLLDMPGLVAGTQFRGQFESRMKGVVSEAVSNGNIILVIDEIHNIMGAGDAEGAMNAANILKPTLAKGQIRVIGSTTLNEYRRFIEKDSALERRFQKIIVNEPTVDETIEILKGIRGYYEEQHHVTYSDELIKVCVTLADRYITDRFFPDKAIDIIDEAGSRSNLDQKLLMDHRKMKDKLQELQDEKVRVETQIANSKTEDIQLFEKQATLKIDVLKCEKALKKLEKNLKPIEISIADIASVVELWTGIPVKSITEEESAKLLDLENRLHKRVIGQQHAIESLSQSIRRNRAGFGRKKKPISFIFVGPTGVGKTELAKAVTEVMFSDEKAMIRIDMSEYMEAHTVSKLIGSPPGYVGYDDAGQLTEKVRRKPYSVILFDEIEKAHVDVFNLLLQILDDGRLTDSHGRTINFENTIIIMTSNAGTTLKGKKIGFNSNSYEALESRVHTVLKEMFRPEFLNRVDEIIVFEELTQEQLRVIVDLMLDEVRQSLAEHDISLEVSDDVKDKLVKKGYDPQYGARPLRKVIQKEIEDMISNRYLENRLVGISKIMLTLLSDRIQFKYD